MKILFITGKLAERALKETLAGMQADFDYEVTALKISVAALMTTPFILHTLRTPSTDLVMIPGLCRVEPSELEQALGVKVEKGPKDLRDIPYYFGAEKTREGYGEYDLTILAEINDAPTLPVGEILHKARYYTACGADVIDVGGTPGQPATNIGEIVSALRSEGFRVSIDSVDPQEILAADKAGAELLLSLNAQNLHLAPDLRCTPVIIPDFGKGLDSLAANVEAVERLGKTHYLIDPILAPIGFGFTESLVRYVEARRRFPHAEILMGVGNITELTDADSTGINALLTGVMSELQIRYALTTEVASWAVGSVRELDLARRLMFYARQRGVLPKGIDDGLLTIKDRRVDCPSEAELRDMQRMVTDPNFRIYADREAIYVFNRDLFMKDTDIHRIFDQIRAHLGHEPIGHAFYLGRELMKARLAMRLGKKYIQEEDLTWGYLDHDLPQ
ncbi:MAG: PTS mannitol transporter subunit IIABC [Candidatus Methylomirabilota bacterium]|nr:PTS mannitol transporter subunit IIABC [candidate division NC10 bacterium]PWB48699.1 MAG: PTS mannitol transporter subunit IIABC [candidate division NC10 bacterium]